jgi:DNA-binding MurR/RpiR family transcriptional regulator
MGARGRDGEMIRDRGDFLGGPLKDLAERIRMRAATFSEGQRLVADFILREYEKAAFLTAARLGQRVGVSESTVVRFAMALGYTGYPEMQRILQEMVRSRLTTVDRLLGSVEGLEDNESVLAKIMQRDIDNIRQTLQETVPESFEHAVQLIVSAERVYVSGLRSASAPAMFLAFCLNWVLGNTKSLISGVEDWLEQTTDLGERDLLVAISFPRYTRKTVEMAEYARGRGARVLAITDSVMSPLARHATVVLSAHSDIESYVDSFTAPLSLINALLTAVAQRQQDKTVASLDRLEKEWRKYRLFWEE